MLDLLGDLNRGGVTLVVVTHDPNVARRADRVVVLRDGEVVRVVAGASVTDLATLFAEPDSVAGVGAVDTEALGDETHDG